MNSENANKALPSRENDWPHDTTEYTFALRALHVLGHQMRGEEWPADPKNMFESNSLPGIAEALRRRCASGQAWAMVQLPTGEMFKIKRETADLREFDEALLQGKIAVNSDWIESEDFRPLTRFEGTKRWLFIETRAIEPHPNAFDGVEINRDPLTMPFWSFGMSAAWIMCASPDAARHYWNGPIEAAMVEADPDHPTVARAMTFEMAQANLMSRLAADEITATAVSSTTGKGQAIEPSEWRSLAPRYRDGRGGLEIYFDTGNGGQYSAIRLLRDDVLQLWPLMGVEIDKGRAADADSVAQHTPLTEDELRSQGGEIYLSRAIEWIAWKGHPSSSANISEEWDHAERELFDTMSRLKPPVSGLPNGSARSVDLSDIAWELTNAGSAPNPSYTAIANHGHVPDRMFAGTLTVDGAEFHSIRIPIDLVFTTWPGPGTRLPHQEVETLLSGAAGRPSSMHLVEQEFQRRLKVGEAAQTNTAEAAHLAEWLKLNHPAHPTAGEKAIRNKLGPLRRKLEATA